MWAIIKAIIVYFVLRIIFGFIAGFFAVAAAGSKVPMENVLEFCRVTNTWSFWVSLIIAVYVLIKSW